MWQWLAVRDGKRWSNPEINVIVLASGHAHISITNELSIEYASVLAAKFGNDLSSWDIP